MKKQYEVTDFDAVVIGTCKEFKIQGYDLDDLISESRICVFKALKEHNNMLEEETAFGYVKTIVKNKLHNLYRKASKGRKVSLVFMGDFIDRFKNLSNEIVGYMKGKTLDITIKRNISSKAQFLVKCLKDDNFLRECISSGLTFGGFMREKFGWSRALTHSAIKIMRKNFQLTGAVEDIL